MAFLSLLLVVPSRSAGGVHGWVAFRTGGLRSRRRARNCWAAVVGDLDEAVLIDGERAAPDKGDGRGEERRGGDDSVELTLLAAGIDTGGLELGDQRELEPATEEALPESLGVDGDDGRLDSGREQLVEQRATRLEPERQGGGARGRRARQGAPPHR